MGTRGGTVSEYVPLYSYFTKRIYHVYSYHRHKIYHVSTAYTLWILLDSIGY